MRCAVVSFVAGLLVAAVPALAAEARVGSAGALPEAAAPAAVRAAVAADGIRVVVGDATLADLWLAPKIAQEESGPPKPGVVLPGYPEGSLFGVLRLADRWTDFKGKAIAAGTYTLRYSVQPADGNHMGVSEYRDFLLLVPASSDPGTPAVGDRKALYALSDKATGTNHPAVLSIVPPPKDAAVPSVTGSAATVVVVATAGGRTLGLVLRGRASAEGY